ncbi:uncharacterized protein LOC132551223 [Ylistrum balloti]|uniref:uncharacterized protein LOC132551223 n=1 Tax=Ylistrum balloti TaxID=509963 RepID=UPI002905F44E|nr:uncharacterized protein LOC132551223 [Ylistrum balloti]
MDRPDQENQEHLYCSIKSVYSESGTGSDDKFARIHECPKSPSSLSPPSENSKNHDVNIHVLNRSIRALNISHGRHLAQEFYQNTSFPDMVPRHLNCVCCNRERKWVCWRMEINKKMADIVLNGTHHSGGLRTWEMVEHRRGLPNPANTGDFDAQGDGNFLPSHHFLLFGIPRARLHDRLRH